MRFLLDENLPGLFAADLRKLGLDAVDIREIARPGLTDTAVYNLSRQERRHLVSLNYKDFGNPLLFPPTLNTGIVVVRMPKCSVGQVVALVTRYLSTVKPTDLSGCLVVLETTRARRKRLIA